MVFSIGNEYQHSFAPCKDFETGFSWAVEKTGTPRLRVGRAVAPRPLKPTTGHDIRNLRMLPRTKLGNSFRANATRRSRSAPLPYAPGRDEAFGLRQAYGAKG